MPPPGIEFLIKATGSHWGGCHSNGSAPQPGMGVGSKPRPGPERCLLQGPHRAAGPATNRGRPVPRHPGRISWESWSVSGGNGRPTPLQTGRCDEAMGHRSQAGRI